MVADTPVEEMLGTSQCGNAEDRLWNESTDAIAEERRVCVAAADIQDRCTAMSSGRAATPWQQSCGDSALEDSFGSDLSSIPGLTAAGDCDDQDGSPAGARIDSELIDGDHDESADSGIDQTVSEWKAHEKQHPSEKRSRFSRFVPTVNAPKFWRARSGALPSSNDVTRIEVMPSMDLD
jgi:hypothetical protein